jgi:hypothetical protein
VFFAASGDKGAGVMWPACSANVVGVGGTTLQLNSDGTVSSETGWSGSGGGISSYEPKPTYQTNYGITGNRRRVPDISYNANPSTGVPVYYNGNWYRYGGTSAGAPQWAAIHALGRSSSNANIYQKASSPANSSYLRDVVSGSNGAYTAVSGYDCVTGLGSPLTTDFASLLNQSSVNSLNLVPAGQSNPLNSTNQFVVGYLANGTYRTAYVSNGTFTLNVDVNTDLSVAGTSTASTPQEKWVFTSDDSPITGTNMTLYYYDLLSQNTSYIITGGGNPENPNATYVTAPPVTSTQPETTNLQLNQTPQLFWSLRGTEVSVTNPLSGTSMERWATRIASWNIVASNQTPLQLSYYHQFLLNITGSEIAPQWYNSNESAQVAMNGVFGRTGGRGQKVTAYSVDNEATVKVEPTTGNLNISVFMDAPHRLNITSITQYKVSLDDSASAMLASITSPTISGDNYWYDAGSNVSLSINGVTSRVAGAGQRLTSVTRNEQTMTTATTDIVDVFKAELLEPQMISATLTQQYQLTLLSGAVKSVTNPSIIGDAGWYDAGTAVTVTYDYSWNTTQNQSRLNAVNYILSQRTPIPLGRSGKGTFPVQLTLTKPESVAITPVTQYYFLVSGGSNLVMSKNSPTNDSLFDFGTVLFVSSDQTWTTEQNGTKQLLVSYTLDGATVNATIAEAGKLTTQEIVVDSLHQLTFNSVTQHLISFQFKAAPDSEGLTPTTLQIRIDNSDVVNVPVFRVWLDKGTQFQVNHVVWQNTDITPTEPERYVVDRPLNVTVLCRVFDATLLIRNHLGVPVPAAQVSVTFSNQTTVLVVSGEDGVVTLTRIPLGTFNASVSYHGQTTTVSGNASVQTITEVSLPPPPLQVEIYVTASVIIMLTAGCIIVLIAKRRRQHARQVI